MNYVGTVVIDGECGLCKSSMAVIGSRLSSPVEVKYFQDVSAKEASEMGLTKEQLEKSVWWIDSSGETYGAHLAVAQILMKGSLGLKILGGILRIFPFSKLASAVYHLVAEHRGSISSGLIKLESLHKRLLRRR